MLKRKTPLRAKAPMARKPIKRGLSSTKDAKTRYKERSASKTRDKRWRSPKYLAWVRTQPCVVCGATTGIAAHHMIGMYNLGGMGLKAPDSYAMPACDPAAGSFNDCHQQIHRIKALRDQQPAFLRTTLRAGLNHFTGADAEQLLHALSFIEAKEAV
ncbi:DUF968 domain-containing protein [Vreelandella venusta]|uniref:DUF968 domain-containing protein n=1 Tax=Vreelandella venusta TaxID=44935 RepID=UPI0040444F21